LTTARFRSGPGNRRFMQCTDKCYSALERENRARKHEAGGGRQEQAGTFEHVI
jgi:hypothetical protein